MTRARHGRCLGFLLGMATTTIALVVATQHAMGTPWA